jgi:hypothetical protein
MSGAMPPLPQYDFMVWCSVKKEHRDNFSFTWEWDITNCGSRTQRFQTVNTKISHRTRSSVSSIPPPILTTYLPRTILMLYTHILLGLPRGFRNKIPHAFPGFPIQPTCPAHRTLLDFTIQIILGNLCKSTLCNVLQCSLTSSFFGPHISLSTPLTLVSYFLPS